jgi:hypothetical protein
MDQDEYDRIVRHCEAGIECCAGDTKALLEAFEELHNAVDAHLEDEGRRDLDGVLFDNDGNYRLRVRKP